MLDMELLLLWLRLFTKSKTGHGIIILLRGAVEVPYLQPTLRL